MAVATTTAMKSWGNGAEIFTLILPSAKSGLEHSHLYALAHLSKARQIFAVRVAWPLLITQEARALPEPGLLWIE